MWLIGKIQGGHWVALVNLPPCEDEEIAKRHAMHLTRVTEEKHTARMYIDSGRR